MSDSRLQTMRLLKPNAQSEEHANPQKAFDVFSKADVLD